MKNRKELNEEIKSLQNQIENLRIKIRELRIEELRTSDEHSIEVARMLDRYLIETENFNLKRDTNSVIMISSVNRSVKIYTTTYHVFSSENQNAIDTAIDYLRSKGYALPYLGISVEEQIEFGWIKLK